MAPENLKRKLTTILSADVKGYSRFMGEDEEGTIHTLKAHLEVISGFIQQHRGRVVATGGDSILAEFGSVVDAVRCAVGIQRELKERNKELAEDRRLEFRIGINLGDVVEEGDTILGDGVNIAARVQNLAEAGGISITGTVYDQIENKLDLRYDYLGEQQVKNISKPVRVYRVLMGPKADRPEVSEAHDLPEKPSIGVLPFVNMTGDPGQEYFSDGITEEIITGLSKVPGLIVIARNSTFSYKGKSVKVQQVGQELHVRYVLEGSVRRAGDQVRITVQLVDATTGHHLWAERYDRSLKDIFAIQDEISVNVMRAMQLELIEGKQACEWIKRGSQKIEAYEKGMKGMELFRLFSPEGNIQAKKIFEECIALDSDYPGPYVMLAWTQLTAVYNGWSKSPEESITQALELAQRAIALDSSQADAFSLLGNIYLLTHQYEKAITEGERAVALNPNGADSHVWLAMILTSSGKPEDAIELIYKAIRLNPFPPNWYFMSLGNAYFLMGEFNQAIEAYKKALQRSPNFLLAHIGLAASCSAANHAEDARVATSQILKIDPKFSLEAFSSGLPYKNEKHKDFWVASLRKAGLK